MNSVRNPGLAPSNSSLSPFIGLLGFISLALSLTCAVSAHVYGKDSGQVQVMMTLPVLLAQAFGAVALGEGRKSWSATSYVLGGAFVASLIPGALQTSVWGMWLIPASFVVSGLVLWNLGRQKSGERQQNERDPLHQASELSRSRVDLFTCSFCSAGLLRPHQAWCKHRER